ncbi:hypothetical protein C8F01DRAFT_1367963 [Mycena amicta]|nr:hypothetical protein C8F01DRAFT_1367963 [Mycena amicta]
MDEYEVEAISSAKVVRESKKHIWHYQVKWKGYPASANTWEPLTSFAGSEGLVDAFWARVELGGRDYNNMTLFKVGESFTPSRRTPKVEPRSSRSTTRETRSNKRRRSSLEAAEPETKPAKRGRVTSPVSAPVARAAAARTSRAPPASPPKLTKSISTRSIRRRKPQRSPSPDEVPPSPSVFSEAEDDEPKAAQDDDDIPMPPVPALDQIDKVPSHRMRAANPLVKMVDDFSPLDVAISAKRVKALNTSANTPVAGPSNGSPQRREPGPGRSSKETQPHVPSSILRVENGTLKTVKRTTRHEERTPDEPEIVMPPVQTVPTSNELLRLGGFDAEAADALADFEDEDAPVAPPTDSALQQNISAAKNNLFPPGTSPAFFNPMPANSRRSTIFGPLGFGSYASPSSASDSKLFSLQLDVNIALQVVLMDSNQPLPAQAGNQPIPGKFFHEHNAQKLLDTVRTGPSARVVMDEGATEEQTTLFQRFHSRLAQGEMFTMMAGSKFMAFCSSDALVHRLNLPAALLAFSNSVFAAELVIQNDAAYVDVVMSIPTNAW